MNLHPIYSATRLQFKVIPIFTISEPALAPAQHGSEPVTQGGSGNQNVNAP
jgi:hypothetical protein